MLKQLSMGLLGVSILIGTALPPELALSAGSASARITSITGTVQARASSGGSWHPASANEGLNAGGSVRTGGQSKTSVQYSNHTMARLGANTLLTIKNDQLNLLKGKTMVQKEKGHGNLKIKTPSAVAAVVGTQLFVEHNDSSNISHVTTLDGVVEVTTNKGETATVNPGEWVEIDPSKPLEKPSKFDWDALQKRERFLLDPNFVPKPGDAGSDGQDWK